jgi:hypothetical protein
LNLRSCSHAIGDVWIRFKGRWQVIPETPAAAFKNHGELFPAKRKDPYTELSALRLDLNFSILNIIYIVIVVQLMIGREIWLLEGG